MVSPLTGQAAREGRRCHRRVLDNTERARGGGAAEGTGCRLRDRLREGGGDGIAAYGTAMREGKMAAELSFTGQAAREGRRWHRRVLDNTERARGGAEVLMNC